jgi:hypothetical protein
MTPGASRAPLLCAVAAMRDNATVVAPRPNLFYRKCMPAKTELRLALDLPGLGGRAQFVKDVIAAVEKIEKECDAERSKTGRTGNGRCAQTKYRRLAEDAKANVWLTAVGGVPQRMASH